MAFMCAASLCDDAASFGEMNGSKPFSTDSENASATPACVPALRSTSRHKSRSATISTHRPAMTSRNAGPYSPRNRDTSAMRDSGVANCSAKPTNGMKCGTIGASLRAMA
jgi:hypothetical protein